MGRQKEHVGTRRLLPDGPGQLYAGATRHADIQNDRVHGSAADQFKHLTAVFTWLKELKTEEAPGHVLGESVADERFVIGYDQPEEFPLIHDRASIIADFLRGSPGKCKK
jgi:hypothetical protein